MEKPTSEYPTKEQIKETLEAYRKGGDALMELVRKRRAEEEVAEPNASQGSNEGSARSEWKLWRSGSGIVRVNEAGLSVLDVKSTY